LETFGEQFLSLLGGLVKLSFELQLLLLVASVGSLLVQITLLLLSLLGGCGCLALGLIRGNG